ncbi:MAG: hypothetical protein J6S76_06405 [Clostridia bacterium]|nr:hypothetical protein [Clostridia bacterium]
MFPQFHSALVVRPKPKQFSHMTIVLVLYLATQIYRTVSAIRQANVTDAVLAAAMIAPSVWYTVHIRRYAEANVTEMIPPIAILGAARILCKIVAFFAMLPAFSVSALLILLAECVFWVTVVVCATRAICGTYKLIVPLTVLFFGFFWPFITLDLRRFGDILAVVLELLLVWFPLDAVTFTSLYVPTDSNSKKS